MIIQLCILIYTYPLFVSEKLIWPQKNSESLVRSPPPPHLIAQDEEDDAM